MQLKLTRSQKQSGLITKSVVFCLTARAEFEPEEAAHIHRYRLGGEILYSSAAAQRHADRARDHLDGSAGGLLKGLANAALSRLALNVTVNSLGSGQYIECKSLDELCEAEAAIMAACGNLRSYLLVAATFDGRQQVYDFSSGAPELVAFAEPSVPLVATLGPPEPLAGQSPDDPTAPALPSLEAFRETPPAAGPDASDFAGSPAPAAAEPARAWPRPDAPQTQDGTMHAVMIASVLVGLMMLAMIL